MKTVTDFDPATRDDVMRYLAGGIVEDNLPGPVQIHTRGKYAGVIAEDLTDAHTWIAWLGCGALHTDTYTLGEGRRYERTWAEVAWSGWTIRVLLTRGAVTSPIDAFKQRVAAHRAAGHSGGVGGCKVCPAPAAAVKP